MNRVDSHRSWYFPEQRRMLRVGKAGTELNPDRKCMSLQGTAAYDRFPRTCAQEDKRIALSSSSHQQSRMHWSSTLARRAGASRNLRDNTQMLRRRGVDEARLKRQDTRSRPRRFQSRRLTLYCSECHHRSGQLDNLRSLSCPQSLQNALQGTADMVEKQLARTNLGYMQCMPGCLLHRMFLRSTPHS